MQFFTLLIESLQSMLMKMSEWTAVGSTKTVNAITNTRTTAADADGPIFLLDGTALIANNKADLWDFWIQAPINITQDENPFYFHSMEYPRS